MNSPQLGPVVLDDAAIVAGFAALAHPARLEILRELGARDACCCKDVVERLDLAQSTVSQHLRVLVDAGLVNYEADNRRSRYSLDHARLSALKDAMGRFLNVCCSARGR